MPAHTLLARRSQSILSGPRCPNGAHRNGNGHRQLDGDESEFTRVGKFERATQLKPGDQARGRPTEAASAVCFGVSDLIHGFDDISAY